MSARRDIADDMRSSYRASAIASMRAALETARAGIREAERLLDAHESGGRTSIDTTVRNVLHAMSWGQVNALSSIESAMSWVESIHEVTAAECDAAAPTEGGE